MNKNTAYIIGTYLGDGHITSNGRTFVLQTIDIDFAEKCKNSLDRLTENSIIMKEVKRETQAKRKVYSVSVSDVKFCKFLKDITNCRKNLPKDFSNWDYETQLELISGLLDSEGYVSITRLHEYAGKKVFDMKIGIGACDEWLLELYYFLKEKKITVGKITTEILKSGKLFNRFIFNKKSFIKNGLYFNIKRKQNRINEYNELFPGSTTTRRIPKTNETKLKMSIASKNRQRVKGRFVKVMI